MTTLTLEERVSQLEERVSQLEDYGRRVECWMIEGDAVFKYVENRFFLFKLGVWWADRPWRPEKLRP